MTKYLLIIVVFIVTACGGGETTDGAHDYAWVYISNEARQCEFEGLTKEETAQQLIETGIDVVESKCANIEGIAITPVCGGTTAEINLHKIYYLNLTDAEALGFSSVHELESGYTDRDCNT